MSLRARLIASTPACYYEHQLPARLFSVRSRFGSSFHQSICQPSYRCDLFFDLVADHIFMDLERKLSVIRDTKDFRVGIIFQLLAC